MKAAEDLVSRRVTGLEDFADQARLHLLKAQVRLMSGAAQVVCKPNAIKAHKKFEGEVYVLTKDEGGRHTPFFSNYKPQFFFRTADITGKAPFRSCSCF